jgi:hypothetical protein
MGKVFKKITKPIAKVFDKVVPNEIKPALPYLAAFAPFMLPAGFGATMFSSMSPTVSSMIARGLVGGGANALSQLAQEGNEGDLSLGRVALAAAPAALSAPGAGDYFSGMQTGIPSPGDTGLAGGELGFLDKAKNFGLGSLEKGANFLSGEIGSGGVGDILSPGGTPVGLNLATAQAASVPLISGATESAIILGELQAMRDYERQFQGFQDFTGQQLADFSAGRRAAILASMGRAGFGEDEISATLAQLGLRNGGIISLMGGGMPSMEMDYRGGGFIPVGAKERADDVPARLSKNEFVMTADAVRAAGGGSVNEGARRMYELMNNLEARA